MIETRSYILDRLKSRTVSIDEFNYDKLSAPPLLSLLTPQDIQELNKIAHSIKYSAQPELKEKMITQIMNRRGFVKFYGGTNRIAYRPVEDNRFLVKVAIDAVGQGDNPREFANQMIFKPFVTKVFEVSPCGTVGVFERVVPITNREEFLSVAEDIFEVINKWFIGEYVLEDFGTRFFMNWGIRKGFGPVLLDFPYVYKLDGDKLFCNAPNPNNPSGCCEGVIDYDPGYNFLYCTKCGVKYKAVELQKAVEENKVIVKSEGDIKMKVSVSGGNKGVTETRTTGMYYNHKRSMPTKPINGRDTKMSNTSNRKEKEQEKKHVITPISVDESLIKEHVPTTTPVVPTPESMQEEYTELLKKFVAGCRSIDSLNGNALLEAMINMLTKEYMKNFDQYDSGEQMVHFENILAHVTDTIDKMKNKDLVNQTLTEAFKDRIKAAQVVSPITIDESLIKEHVPTTTPVVPEPEVVDEVFSISAALDRIYEEYMNKGYTDDITEEILHSDLFAYIMENKAVIDISCTEFGYDEEDHVVEFVVVPELKFCKVEDNEDSDLYKINYKFGPGCYIDITEDDFLACTKSMGYSVYTPSDEDVDESGEDVTKYGDLKYYSSRIMDVQEIKPENDPAKVLVITDQEGNYLTTGRDNNIVVIDMIDDQSVESLSFVTTNWLSAVLNENRILHEAVIENDKSDNCEKLEKDNGVEDDTASNHVSSSIPTGVFAPGTEMGVNGVGSTDEHVED